MTAPSKDRKAALGLRSHSGWAAYCVLAGDARAPEIMARGRMQLCDPSIEGSKQPFHQAEPMAFADADAFIALCGKATARLASQAIGALIEAWHPIGCTILTTGGRPLPDLKAILASHALIHTAEGAFYRDALETACAARGMAVRRVAERAIEEACGVLPVSLPEARSRLAEFGRTLGPPWTQDEKLAALGAWLMLASLPARRPRR